MKLVEHFIPFPNKFNNFNNTGLVLFYHFLHENAKILPHTLDIVMVVITFSY